VGRRGCTPGRRGAAAVADSAASVERIVASGETVYGVNTGFGLLANTRIPDDRLGELQTNLILSHSAGLGEPLPRHVSRLMIVLKLLGLGRGHSGVRIEVIEGSRSCSTGTRFPSFRARAASARRATLLRSRI
jgi:histidine ammonia-lyase